MKVFRPSRTTRVTPPWLTRPIRVQLHAFGLGQLIVRGDFIQHILDVSTGFADDALAAFESIGHGNHVGLRVFHRINPLPTARFPFHGFKFLHLDSGQIQRQKDYPPASC